MKRVLLDDSVIDTVMALGDIGTFEFCMTARQRNVVPEFIKKYPSVSVIPNVARLGHSMLDGGEVFGDERTKELSNALLALSAHQREITRPADQNSYNQRDDADLIVAAVLNNCEYLVSNDKKFMLMERVKSLAIEHGLSI